jgi:hypothetical protein
VYELLYLVEKKNLVHFLPTRGTLTKKKVEIFFSTFTEFFMINFEKKYMYIIEEYGVEVWLRFVDDVFILIREKEKAFELLEKLNSLHPSIKFTYEPEISTSEENDTFELPFSDVLVASNSEGFQTSVYRKKTFTGTYLNWNSGTSRDYKIGLIKCLVNRAY